MSRLKRSLASGTLSPQVFVAPSQRFGAGTEHGSDLIDIDG